MRYIGLLDCNNFFVSCERLFRPDLRNKPTVVLSSNDGCVVARSQEVKDMDIPMGVPYFKVKKELQEAEVAVFSGNIALYRDISARVMSVLKRELQEVEPYSIDESFFVIDAKDNKEAHAVLKHIKRMVEREIGVPVSLGAARTKTIAKYASEKEKRDSGVCVLVGEQWFAETNLVPMHKIWGVGGKTSEKMRSHDLVMVADFVHTDPARIEKLFGVHGTRLLAELTEQAAHVLSNDEMQKSIMSTRSFKEAIHDQTVLEDALAYHISHVAEELRSRGAVAQYLSIMVLPSRHGDWVLQGIKEEILLPAPTDDTRVFLREAKRVLARVYKKEVPYKKVGAVLSHLMAKEYVQTSLFEQSVTAEENDVLMQTIDTLNTRFGRNTLTLGRYRKETIWGAGKEHISPNYTTNWDDLMSVTT